MKAMKKFAEVPLPFSGISDPFIERGDDSRRLSGWLSDCHGVWYNVSLIVPPVLFVVYLALQAKKSFTKLSHGRSYIMIAYYGLLWLVSVLNLAWCSLQTWECTSGKEFSWNLLSMFTTSGMLFLEISLMAFLLQGNYASGLDGLTRTFVVSGIVVGADVLLKAIYVFGFEIPLFIHNEETTHKAIYVFGFEIPLFIDDEETTHKAIYVFGFEIPLFIDDEETTHKVKWGLWVVHKLLLTAVYGVILCMYHSKWRDKLPARPAFYNYIIVMFSLNVAALFACGLMGNGVGFGFWLYNLTTICYHAFYLPLLYVTFLADFFQEEDMRLENAYYSEMKDAGFFDADWD